MTPLPDISARSLPTAGPIRDKLPVNVPRYLHSSCRSLPAFAVKLTAFGLNCSNSADGNPSAHNNLEQCYDMRI